MPRAPEPFTPDIDLAAHRAFTVGSGLRSLLTPELEAFCQSGVSVKIAACGPGEYPAGGLGCGCRMLPGGRMRILLVGSRNRELLAILERGGSLAATFTQPYTHRSIQVKGPSPVVAVPGGEDLEAALEQCEYLRRELVSVGYPPGFSAAYCQIEPEDLVALDLAPVSAFVQTPGPGAGAELKP